MKKTTILFVVSILLALALVSSFSSSKQLQTGSIRNDNNAPRIADYTGYGSGTGGAYLVTLRQTLFNDTDTTISDAEAFTLSAKGTLDWNATTIVIGVKTILDDVTPASPTEVNLAINGTAVDDGDIDTGSWTYATETNCSLGKFYYEITADALTSLVIDNITIIFETHHYDVASVTQTDAENIWIIGETFTFNMSSFYVDRFVNFTVPKQWGDYQCFDDLVNVTGNATESINGSYDLVQFENATSGAWSFRGYSTNLCNKIENYNEDLEETSIAEYEEQIYFNGTFNKEITGDVIVEVYNPSLIDDDLVYTDTEAVANATEAIFGLWDISGDVDDNRGYFRVCIYGNNKTDGYYGETIVRIYDDVTDEDSDGWDLTSDEPATTINWIPILTWIGISLSLVAVIAILYYYFGSKRTIKQSNARIKSKMKPRKK